MYDPGREDRTTPADIAVADRMSRAMADGPPENRFGIGMLIRMINWLPLIVMGRFSRFVKLSVEDQDRYLEKLGSHPWRPIRLAGVGIKVMTSIQYWQHPKVLAEIGVDESELLPEIVEDKG